MHDQELAIIRALVPIAWADGDFAEKEQEMLDALLDAYGASEGERASVREYAKEKRTLEDITLQELSADDRRILLQHAVLISFADGEQAVIAGVMEHIEEAGIHSGDSACSGGDPRRSPGRGPGPLIRTPRRRLARGGGCLVS